MEIHTLQEQNHELSSRLDTVMSEARSLETTVAELKAFNDELRRELSRSTKPSPCRLNRSGMCYCRFHAQLSPLRRLTGKFCYNQMFSSVKSMLESPKDKCSEVSIKGDLFISESSWGIFFGRFFSLRAHIL